MKIICSAVLIASATWVVSPWNSAPAEAARPFLHSASATRCLTTAQGLVAKEQPLAAYMLDDGTAEMPVGFGTGAENFEAIWFNQFNVIPGVTTIHSVSIAWGAPSNSDPSPDGMVVTIGVWSDPNGDGTPDDAALLGSVVGLVQNSNTDTFVTYCFDPPVELPAGATSFFVGNTNLRRAPEALLEALDTSPSQRRSWVAGNSSGGPVNINHPGSNDFLGLVDDFGLPGNWLIRADDVECDESLSFVAAASVKNRFRVELPLTGSPGIEDRSGGSGGNYSIYMTFNHLLASVGGATTSCGEVSQVMVDPRDGHNVRISLTNLANACNTTYIDISATGIMDQTGHVMSEADVTMGLLIGDVTANATVDGPDLEAIRATQGQSLSAVNFRSDVDGNGVIDTADYHKANRYLGTSLPEGQ